MDFRRHHGGGQWFEIRRWNASILFSKSRKKCKSLCTRLIEFSMSYALQIQYSLRSFFTSNHASISNELCTPNSVLFALQFSMSYVFQIQCSLRSFLSPRTLSRFYIFVFSSWAICHCSDFLAKNLKYLNFNAIKIVPWILNCLEHSRNSSDIRVDFGIW